MFCYLPHAVLSRAGRGPSGLPSIFFPSRHVTEQTIVQGWGWGGLFREGERERKGEEKKKEGEIK